MKKLCFYCIYLSISFALSSPSFSFNGIDSFDARPFFEQLQSLYEKGTKPEKSDLIGKTKIGRGYSFSKPDEAGGRVLSCQTYLIGQDNGPLFERREGTGCGLDGHSKATFFDEGIKVTRLRHINQEALKVNLSFEETEVCYHTGDQNYAPRWDGRICFKKYNDYLIYKKTSWWGDTYDEVVEMGYFFKDAQAKY